MESNKNIKRIMIEQWDGKSDKEFDPCSLYNWRLDWLEKKVKQHRDRGLEHSDAQYQRWWDEEHKVYQNNDRDLKSAQRLRKKVAIIVPSHYYQVKWLGACLDSCRKTGYFTLLAYDNPFYAENLQVERRMPSTATLMKADALMMKHKTWASGVGIPHAWNMWYGLKMLWSMGFEYVFNLNGDCILEKPENFYMLFEMLEYHDMVTCEYIPKKNYAGTMAWLTKIDIAMDIWDTYVRKIYTFNVGNAEARMGKHCHENGYRIRIVDNPYEAHFKCFPPGDEKNEITERSTFRKHFGLRHLHAEHKVRRDFRMEPVERKYCDFGPNMIFLNRSEQTTLVPYWETGDKKYLEGWWDGKVL